MTRAHVPVLAGELIELTAPGAGDTVIDCTFGAGGHARLIADRIGSTGTLICIDRDPLAEEHFDEVAREVACETRFLRMDYADGLALLCDERLKADVIYLDLGISSMQVDRVERGFSYSQDAPLDMRMDPTAGPTAAQWLATAEEQQIQQVIRDYGEERFAKQIAAAIVAARARGPLLRTRELADLVAGAVRTREPGQDPATRTFQALRIHVNRELEEVSLMLPQAAAHLAIAGRLAVISFHSLEDRIVKRFLQRAARRGFENEVPRRLPLREHEMPQPALKIIGRAVRAAETEIKRNPRARSAILRVAARTAGSFPATLQNEPGARWRN
jgi:16S rRNA (cytosine1402-N4)-methyltransferase